MNLAKVNEQTKLLVDRGHRVLSAHRFAEGEYDHVSRLLRWAEFPFRAKVIDLGSGTGEVARIMRDIRHDLEFTLINISQFQLDYSPDFEKICADFRKVPKPDGEYDAAMFCFSIGHSGHYDALKECARLLKKGGVLFVYDMARVSGDNESMREVDYEVNDRFAMDESAQKAGFDLDFYMQPQDRSGFGKSLLGDDYERVFGGTIPAVWRFIKR